MAAITIYTDGEATDGDLTKVLDSFYKLPVSVVIRLVTNEEKVVNYWNEIESNTELSLDILDDFESEAKEVYAYNDWLTYALPLHQLRSSGTSLKYFDLIDEKKLSLDQMQQFIAILFQVPLSSMPDVFTNWSAFMSYVADYASSGKKVWCPVERDYKCWIDMEKLKRAYPTP
jgi:hypothetical protein